jgi:hypothetical protein
LFRIRDTVVIDTPDSSATSRSVTLFARASVHLRTGLLTSMKARVTTLDDSA